MATSIHPLISARFGTESAKPRAIRAYKASGGWVRVSQNPVLTADAVQSLKNQGYTMIEARWRLKVKQISLARLS